MSTNKDTNRPSAVWTAVIVVILGLILAVATFKTVANYLPEEVVTDNAVTGEIKC